MIDTSSDRTGRLVFAVLVLYFIGSFSSMAGMNATAAVLVGVLLVVARGDADLKQGIRLQFLESGAFSRISLGFALTLVASLLGTQFRPLAYGGRSAEVTWPADALKLWYFAMPFLIAAALRFLDERRRHRALLAWLGMAAPLGILAVIQFFTGFPRPQPIPGMPGRFHAILFLGHHLSTGSIFIFPAFVGSALLAAAIRRRWSRGFREGDGLPSRLHVAVYAAGAIGSLLCLFFSWSRMAWLAMPIGLICVALPWLRPRGRVALALAVAALAIGLFQLPAVQERLTQSIGVNTRFEIWSANWEFFKARPILGVGWRKTFDTLIPYFDSKYPEAPSRPYVGHAHNNFLEMLAGTGLLGTFLWLLWNGAVFGFGWRIFRRVGVKSGATNWIDERASAIAWGILTAWLMLHLNGLTQVNFWEGKVQHQMMLSVGWLLALDALFAGGRRSAVVKAVRN